MKGLYFIIGLGLGMAIGYNLTKKKCEAEMDAEIESVKEAFTKKQVADIEKSKELLKGAQDISDKVEAALSKPAEEKGLADLSKMADLIRKEGYKPEEKKEGPSIYTISPEDFGEGGYETISLTMFSDGVICDDCDERVEDVNRKIGDALDHFGEYEEDAVYVRNEDLHCEYEILKDERTYEEVIEGNPRPVEINHGDDE